MPLDERIPKGSKDRDLPSESFEKLSCLSSARQRCDSSPSFEFSHPTVGKSSF
jgi:hypothetical protein